MNNDHGDVYPLFSTPRWLVGGLDEPTAQKLGKTRPNLTSTLGSLPFSPTIQLFAFTALIQISNDTLWCGDVCKA